MATLTTNLNYLQPTAFKLSIDRKNYPNLEFFAQTVSHPSVTLTPSDLPFRRANTYLAGDKLTFDEFSATIILDEDMKSYIEMYQWMERLVEQNNRPATVIQDNLVPTTADITLSVLTSHNNGNKKIKYVDCIPTSIGNINFEATVSDVQYLTFAISFRTNYFTIT